MIKKAMIPIAGLGTRMGPLARAVPKAMFPLVDAAGRVRPVIHYILSEAYAAGARQIALIVSPGHLDLLRQYFVAARKEPDGEVVASVEFLTQPSPMGFGEAVARGADFVGDEPFMLLLGDHVYKAGAGQPSCGQQVAAAFERRGGCAMIGMQPVGPEELSKVGVAGGEPLDRGEGVSPLRPVGVPPAIGATSNSAERQASSSPQGSTHGQDARDKRGQDAPGTQGRDALATTPRVYRCRNFVEKPALDVARRELVTPGLGDDEFLAHAGCYIFTPEIFDCLSRLAVQDRPMGTEIQLADAQKMLLELHPDDYFLYRMAGRAYDTGVPSGFLAAQDAMTR